VKTVRRNAGRFFNVRPRLKHPFHQRQRFGELHFVARQVKPDLKLWSHPIVGEHAPPVVVFNACAYRVLAFTGGT
jgi:hypothetical protein